MKPSTMHYGTRQTLARARRERIALTVAGFLTMVLYLVLVVLVTA